MARRERWQQVPPGMRDLLADESARARAITGRILSCMRRWGYREVVTPTIEYFDTLVRGEGTEAGDRLFKLVDRDGAPAARGEALAALPGLRGPNAIREAQRLADTVESRRVLRDLETLIGILEAYGVGGGVRVDLSIIRDFDYYTGIVFEGHTAALGFPLLGGGRYDRLFEGFGAPHAATGFAVRVDRALAASAGGDAGEEAPDVAVAFADGARGEALRLARPLRQQDLS